MNILHLTQKTVQAFDCCFQILNNLIPKGQKHINKKAVVSIFPVYEMQFYTVVDYAKNVSQNFILELLLTLFFKTFFSYIFRCLDT